ncbi:hypothetical protein ABT084_22900 [Streptomyces sp. NPDC002138]|uniref:hypothetical protein n=1 Tax=Streptomyces sp. NPDC002138 TaxID=3154410 RepID=UPI003318D5A0
METGGDQGHDTAAGAGRGGAEQPVELVYQLTTQDFAQALSARARHTASGRFQRRMLLSAGVLIALIGALSLVSAGPVELDRLAFLGGGVLLAALARYGPQLTARALGGVLAKVGETRAVVSDAGLRVTTADAESRVNWVVQPTYVETPGAFVMLSDDKRAAAMTILPKRGVGGPADLERLRAVLDRNLRRR